MEKEFVTYEQSLALKELGFDEPCFAFWEAEFSKPMKQLGKLDNNGNLLREKTYSAIITDYPEYVLAPLKQQAIKFLLNKCDNLHGGELSIEYFSDESGILNNYGLPFKSILEAIDKLIGLVNDKIV